MGGGGWGRGEGDYRGYRGYYLLTCPFNFLTRVLEMRCFLFFYFFFFVE